MPHISTITITACIIVAIGFLSDVPLASAIERDWWEPKVPEDEKAAWRAARMIIYQVLQEYTEKEAESFANLHTFTTRYIRQRFSDVNALKRYVADDTQYNCAGVLKPSMAAERCDDKYNYLFDFCIFIMKDIKRAKDMPLTEPRLVKLVLQAWLLHPALKVDEDFSNIQHVRFVSRTDLPKLLAKFVTLNDQGFDFKNSVTFQDKTYTIAQMKSVINAGITSYLLDTSKEACKLSSEGMLQFCLANDLYGVIYKLNDLESETESDANRRKLKKMAAGIRLITFLISDPYTYPDEIEEIASKELGLIKVVRELVEGIWTGYQSRDEVHLQALIRYFPKINGFIGCNNQINGGIYLKYEKRVCILRELLDQYRMLVRRRQDWSQQRRSVVIDTRYNYVTLLQAQRQSYDERLGNLQSFATVQAAREGLKRFKRYFSEISRFNEQRALSGVGFIDGRLSMFREKEDGLSANISAALTDIVKRAYTSAGKEVALKTGILTAVVFEGSNPFKWAFSGGNAGDILTATADLSAAIQNLQIAWNLEPVLKRAINLTNTMMSGFKTDQDYIHTVRDLVKNVKNPEGTHFQAKKDSFLEGYDGYTPAVAKSEIEGLCELWEQLVDSGCGIAEECNTPDCVSGNSDRTMCFQAHVDIRTLCTIRVQVYEFQLEYMEALADVMEAKTSQHATMHLTESPVEDATDLTHNDQIFVLAKSSVMTFQLQSKLTLMKICNIFQYRRAGVRPDVCSDVGNGDFIQSLSDSPCATTVDKYDIPIQTSTSRGKDKIDLKSLYQGKFVDFQIPDSNWLVSNNWINADKKDDEAIYVQGFRLFLPTPSTKTTTIISESEAIRYNRLSSSGPSFTLIPSKDYEYEYRDRHGPCIQQSFDNPYNRVFQWTRKVCPVTVEPTTALDVLHAHSIFSLWRFRLIGHTEQEQMAELPADFKLKAVIRMCKKEFDEMSTRRTRPKKNKKKKGKDRNEKKKEKEGKHV